VLRAQELPDAVPAPAGAQLLGDVRRVDPLALVPDLSAEACGPSTVQATIATVSHLRAADNLVLSGDVK
jgi:predicted phage gp36 major capsid-like protein